VPALLTAIPHGVNTAAGVREQRPLTVKVVTPATGVGVWTIEGAEIDCFELQPEIRLTKINKNENAIKQTKLFFIINLHDLTCII
jgi:hypothetical protein